MSNKIIISACATVLLSTPAMAGWKTTWIDDFNGDAVNWQNWNAQTQANYNNEVQCYTDDDSSAQKNFDVSQGTLKIIARKEQLNCSTLNGQSKSWTSGRLNSKDKREFLYGRIESRIKFHNLEGGTWPAFWMLENRISEQPYKGDNDNAHWPNSGAGEIDVWEWFSNSPTTYITNFFNQGGSACGAEHRVSYPNGPSDVLAWHDYAIEWTADNVKFYMDNNLVASQDISACAQYKEPMFVLLNLAMGGNLGGAIDPALNQATFEIDYIAHCNASDNNGLSSCNEQTAAQTMDDDNDGIFNNLDNCPQTPTGEAVDDTGCTPATVNHAPTVTMSLHQESSTISTIDPANGIVTIMADVTDNEVEDTHHYDWTLSDGIPSPVINDGQVTFEPSSMTNNSAHSIELTVTDDGSPAMSSSHTLFVSVQGQAETAPEPTTVKDTSGGATLYLLLGLGLIGVQRRSS